MAKKTTKKKPRKSAAQKMKIRVEALDLLDQAHVRLVNAAKKLRESGAPKGCISRTKSAADSIRKAEKACAL